MTRTVFYGFGGFVGTINGLSTCTWWSDDPQSLKWANSALIPVDLSKNPTAVRNKQIQIADIQVDDHRVDGGRNTVGPLWPVGSTIGQIWLSESYYATLSNRPPRQPASAPNDAYDYELETILYWDGDLAGRRFYGFHAKLLKEQGPLSLVQIWNAGTGKVPGQPPAGTWWLDLNAVAHPRDPIATQISSSLTEGALFLDSDTVKSLALIGPKRPPLFGYDFAQA